LQVVSGFVSGIPDLSTLAPAFEIIINGIFTGKVIEPLLQHEFINGSE